MRLLLLILLGLVCLIQYPLWPGKGGWLKVWELQRQVAARRSFNEGMRARNAALDAEVRDLQTGTGALEERARSELGMMKVGEIFVHIVPKDQAASPHAPLPHTARSRAAAVAHPPRDISAANLR
jgi:cell division protein FtsB